MRSAGKLQMKPELKQIVREASEALARLDANRLEELTQCCQALNRKLLDEKQQPEERRSLLSQTHDAASELAVFTRVLEMTRANLNVIARLRALHEEHMEEDLDYGRTQAQARHWGLLEATDGNN